MQAPDYDLLVIGGGPAGSCAAACARQRGMRVCIIEKERFPRFRIGESLLPMGNAVLRATGVWPKIAAAGFVEKFGARFCLAHGDAEKAVDFSTGYVPGLQQTFQVERARFDAILLDHAIELGADVRRETTACTVREDEHHVSVGIVGRDGRDATISGRWLIDAGGRENGYASARKQVLEPSPFPRRVAVYNHFRGVARAPGRAGGDTVVVRLAEGWFWLIPIDAERTSVGLVTTVEALRRIPGGPEAAFHAAVERSPRLSAWMAGAEPTQAYHVTADYSYFRRELAGPRVVLAGDAAGFFDPIFSSGVYVAMWSSQEAVAMIAKAHRAKRPLSARERARYAHQVKSHADVFRRLIAAFYDNDSFSVFMSPRPPLDLGRGLTSIVAGHARLTWPLWWRFCAFLGFCWLQKRFRIVQPIELGAEGARMDTIETPVANSRA